MPSKKKDQRDKYKNTSIVGNGSFDHPPDHINAVWQYVFKQAFARCIYPIYCIVSRGMALNRSPFFQEPYNLKIIKKCRHLVQGKIHYGPKPNPLKIPIVNGFTFVTG